MSSEPVFQNNLGFSVKWYGKYREVSETCDSTQDGPRPATTIITHHTWPWVTLGEFMFLSHYTSTLSTLSFAFRVVYPLGLGKYAMCLVMIVTVFKKIISLHLCITPSFKSLETKIL